MKGSRPASFHRRVTVSLLLTAILTVGLAGATIAHPLGNFTINHFARIETGTERVLIHYVVDMAEIPTLQELQGMNADANEEPSDETLRAYLERVAPQYADGILLTIDNKKVPLQVIAKDIKLIPGSGGLPILRVECDFGGKVPAGSRGAARRLRFEDTNHPDRIGWHEIVVNP
ncbi:MAG: hypothetical protein M3Q76_07350, partial [Acidobacteriota bacterium]|nr:hypothetical protein [Acidobacteriota bacterium]